MTRTRVGRSPAWLLAEGDEPTQRLAVARAAQRGWEAVPVAERARRLERVADAVIDRADRIVALLHEEQGKTPGEALSAEVASAVANLRWLCRRGPAVLAERPLASGWLLHRRAVERRRPYGAVLVVAPWNFPLAIPLIQAASALLAGNAVLLKPSEATPRVGALVGELLGAADLPDGLLQVVQGDGGVGAALVDAGPDKVLFTGSAATGRKVMAAAARHPVPVSLELGGIDAAIVCEDADLELASSAIAWGATFNGGQVCASVERVLVHAQVADALVALVQAKMAAIRPEVDLGRTTTDAQRAVYDRHLADARARGLDVRLGGRHLDGGRYAPTLVCGEGVTHALVWTEETFGPVAAVATFRTDDEAVALHDGVPSGLTASIFSRDRARAEAMAGRLRAGVVAINEVAATLFATPSVPWGGVGASGFGRSHGAEGLLETTWTQVIDRARASTLEVKAPWQLPYGEVQTEALRAFVEALGGRGPERLAAAGRMADAFVRLLTRHPRS